MYKIEDLKRFSVYASNEPKGFLTIEDAVHQGFHSLMAEIKADSSAPTDSVATSVFMRRYGFFIAAQLFLKAHQFIWDGPLDEIYIAKAAGGLSFEIHPAYIREAGEEDLAYILKKYGQPIVDDMAKKGNISKLILWENIWGYVQWMYGSIETAQGKKDVEELLQDEVWQPEMRSSIFRKFLSGRTFEQSATEYKRITCCLYKELPDQNKCPYCPHADS